MERPHLESLSPNIIVDDVNKAIDYYTSVLGFALIASVPETGNFNWAMAMRDGVTFMFQSLHSLQDDMPGLKIDSKGSIGTFFIKMQGIDTLYQNIKGKADIVVDMRTTFYGMKEFVIRDLNGYFLAFAEEIK
jgi:uncharacterized glyoxalase superfamily protein PhnB